MSSVSAACVPDDAGIDREYRDDGDGCGKDAPGTRSELDASEDSEDVPELDEEEGTFSTNYKVKIAMFEVVSMVKFG